MHSSSQQECLALELELEQECLELECLVLELEQECVVLELDQEQLVLEQESVVLELDQEQLVLELKHHLLDPVLAMCHSMHHTLGLEQLQKPSHL